MSTANKGRNREDRVIQILFETGYLFAGRYAASKPRLSKKFLKMLKEHGYFDMPRPDISAYTCEGDQLLIAVTDAPHCPARVKLKKYVNFMNLLLVPVYFQIWITKKKKIGKKKWKYEFEMIG